MVIIRVGLVTRANRTMASLPLGITSVDNGLSAERRRRTQVHISTFTECKVDDGQRSLLPLSKIGLNDIEEAG